MTEDLKEPTRIPLSPLQVQALGRLSLAVQHAERDRNLYMSAILEGAGVSGAAVQYQVTDDAVIVLP